MKTAAWTAAAMLGLITGCASHVAVSVAAPPGAEQPTPMTAPYSSDYAGVQIDELQPPPSGYLPPSRMEFEQVPKAVQRTITSMRSQADATPVGQITREMHEGQTVYRVQFQRRPGQLFHPTLIVAENGDLLESFHVGEPAGANLPR